MDLEADVKDAQLSARRSEWGGRGVVDAIREEWTMQESDRAIAQGNRSVELHAISRCASNVRAEANAAQQCPGIRAREKRRRARLLHRSVKPKHSLVLNAKYADDDPVRINY